MKDQNSSKLVGKNIVEVSIIHIFYLTFTYKNDTHIWPQTHMKPKTFWSFLQYIGRLPYIRLVLRLLHVYVSLLLLLFCQSGAFYSRVHFFTSTFMWSKKVKLVKELRFCVCVCVWIRARSNKVFLADIRSVDCFV